MAGICNIDIEKYFKNESNEDIKRNFKDVMSSDSLTCFINFQKILKSDKVPYPFIIMNTDRKTNLGLTGGAFSILIQKTNSYYFIVLVFRDLRLLFYQTM